MRKTGILLSLIMLMLFATGCGISEEIVINADNSAKVDVVYLFTEEEYAMMKEQSSDDASFEEGFMGTEVIDGVTYYRVGESRQENTSHLNANSLEISADGFYSDSSIDDGDDSESILSDAELDANDTGSDMTGIYPIRVQLTFPYEIVETNGILSEDKMTVTFYSSSEDKGTELYAYTDRFIPTRKPVIDSLSTKKINYIKEKRAKYKIQSLYGITKLTVDKKDVAVAEKTKQKTVTLKEGRHQILVEAPTGSVSYSVYVDNTAPKVTGVKNNKTYKKAVTIKFSDKLAGIKKATLNGKTIKSNKKISKNGKYKLVVTDNAGNKKIIKFKIEK